jgi:hypothetical protein
MLHKGFALAGSSPFVHTSNDSQSRSLSPSLGTADRDFADSPSWTSIASLSPRPSVDRRGREAAGVAAGGDAARPVGYRQSEKGVLQSRESCESAVSSSAGAEGSPRLYDEAG